MFLNVKGREAQGIVEPGAEAAALKAEIIARLNGLRDAEKDAIAIREAFDTATLYAGSVRGQRARPADWLQHRLPRVVGRGDRHRGGSRLRRQHQGVERRSLHRSRASCRACSSATGRSRRRTRRSSTSRPQRFGCSASSPPPTWTGGRWLVWHETWRASCCWWPRSCAAAAPRVAGMQRPAHDLGRRIVVLGFDGLDFNLTRDLMARGRMPHFRQVAARGGFSPLGTSIPPQSPVAWSSFITGLDPGRPRHLRLHPPRRRDDDARTCRRQDGTAAPLRLAGQMATPADGGTRGAAPEGPGLLGRARTSTASRRRSCACPPTSRRPGRATRELSGMGTPDLLGTYGTFSFYTSDPFAMDGAGGGRHHLSRRGP